MKTVLKKGDILVGYRGTEVEFYEVVRVTPKTVLLVSIQKKLLDVNGIEYTAVPIPGSGEKTPPTKHWGTGLCPLRQGTASYPPGHIPGSGGNRSGCGWLPQPTGGLPPVFFRKRAPYSETLAARPPRQAK